MRKSGKKHKLRNHWHWLCGEQQVEGNYFRNALQVKEEISYLGFLEHLTLTQVLMAEFQNGQGMFLFYRERLH